MRMLILEHCCQGTIWRVVKCCCGTYYSEVLWLWHGGTELMPRSVASFKSIPLLANAGRAPTVPDTIQTFPHHHQIAHGICLGPTWAKCHCCLNLAGEKNKASLNDLSRSFRPNWARFKPSGWLCQRLGIMTGFFHERSQGEEGGSWAVSWSGCLETFPQSASSLSPAWPLPWTGLPESQKLALLRLGLLSDSLSQDRMGWICWYSQNWEHFL